MQTQKGEPVLDAKMQPITLPSGAVEVSGGWDGFGGRRRWWRGKVGSVRRLLAGALTAEGTNRFVAADGVTPGVRRGDVCEQGAVEGANQDAVHGTMQLILMQRQAEMMQKALRVFDNEFDKTAWRSWREV